MSDGLSGSVVLASGNAGKLRELAAALSPLDLTLVASSQLNLDSPEETGTTFVENAIIKARHAAAASGLPALADDSGIAVPALNGAPGVYSARYAGREASDADNVDKLLAALDGTSGDHRVAVFHCVIVFMRSAADPSPLVAHGRWPGAVSAAPSGTGGFGYDPVFVPHNAGGKTAAELTPDEKRTLGHRGHAVRELVAQLQTDSAAFHV